jgi:periplasmic protein TonB
VFDTLLPPSRSERWLRPTVAAALLHLSVVAVVLSGTVTPPVSAPAVRDTIRLEIGRPLATEHRRWPNAGRPDLRSIPGPPAPPDIQLAPPRLDLPRLNPNTPLDPRALSGATSAPDSVGASSSAPAPPGSVFAITEVDQLPELVHELHPRYPEALRLAGVSGAVELEYVISTDGRVDPESIRVLLSTHVTFAVAATEAVRAARFRPARRGGRTVAVLVQQIIRFLTR